MKYQPTIGLEIHAELKTKTKMFCDSQNDPLETHPNVNICPVCTGHPGTLPVINKEAVKKVLMTGLAVGGEIAKISYFDRKNYFYPDLPKGYQISQYKHPLIKGGFLKILACKNVEDENDSGGKKEKKIRITRIHLEEDTGRLIHENDCSLVDFNRAGVPLMELVTEPDMNSAEEARAFAEEFQILLRYLGVSGADMEKGELRIEVNVSLSSIDSGRASRELGTKVEIKNLNSFRSVGRAINYEISRQKEILEKEEKVIQETRGWDDLKQKTFSQREKEDSHDYRYFPEPDLPPLRLNDIEDFDIKNLRSLLPELPWLKRERFQKEYGFENPEIFVRDKKFADYFEDVASELLSWAPKEKKEELFKLAFNYLASDLQGILKEKSAGFDDILITPENFAELIKMIVKGEISSRAAKDVLKIMFQKGGDPSEIVKELGVGQTSDEAELRRIVSAIVKKNQEAVSSYKNGKQNALQFLAGKIMAETRGKANPQLLKKILIEIIS